MNACVLEVDRIDKNVPIRNADSCSLRQNKWRKTFTIGNFAFFFFHYRMAYIIFFISALRFDFQVMKEKSFLDFFVIFLFPQEQHHQSGSRA